LKLGSAPGEVYIQLPGGPVMGLQPDQAKRLGGALINESRRAHALAKAERRRTEDE
jgi:hypothetical protein